MPVPSNPHQLIIQKLSENQIPYQLIQHPPAASAEEYQTALETRLEQQVKAIFLKYKTPEGKKYIIFGIPAQKKADLVALAKFLEVKEVKMSTKDELLEQTGCNYGELSPVASAFGMELILDEDLLNEQEIYFNAGKLDASIIMDPKLLLQTETVHLFKSVINPAPVQTEDAGELDTKRHSFAHLMAAAVKQIFPETQFGIGPVIENGCYYDFILPRSLIPEDLPLIEAKMRELSKRNLSFKTQEITLEEAIIHFENVGQPLKVELLNDLRTKGTTSMSEEEKADFGGGMGTKDINCYLIFNLSKGNLDKALKVGFTDYFDLFSYCHIQGFEIIDNLLIVRLEESQILGCLDVTREFLNGLHMMQGCWGILPPEVSWEDGIYAQLEKDGINESTFDEWLNNISKEIKVVGVVDNKIKYYTVDNMYRGEDEIHEFINDTDEYEIEKWNRVIWSAEEIHKAISLVNKNNKNLPTITLERIVDESTGEIVFEDLCKGPHIGHVKELKDLGFALDKFSASYWRGDQDRDIRMQRLYAVVFETKEELAQFQIQREEAKKRDHRVLNESQKYYTISDLVGAGLPLFQPNGMWLRKNIQDYLWQLHKSRGYKQVWTPHIAKEDLYVTSGHAAKFGDELFRVQGKTDKFFMKPMNCPHHMQIFADNQFSYRDMPIRYFEHATVYRDEKPGQLSGFARVRSITQDDGHLFCRLEQIETEVSSIVEIIREFYATIGMDPSWVSLSVRDMNDLDKYLGTNEAWDLAEKSLEQAASKNNLNYKRVEGEAAFYGPKLDFMFKDVMGREWQLATIQCDFNLPNRFDLSFTNEAGEKERPVVIHRAIAGSAERFLGVIIDHFGGRFPLWLAPTQVKILTINTQLETMEYVEKVKSILSEIVLMKPLKYNEIRFEVDDRSESLGKKIRESEMQKVPVLLIIGPKDIAENQVSVRTQEGESKIGLEELGRCLTNFS